MSILDLIHASVAKKQRGFRVKAGLNALRGDRYVKVISVESGKVKYTDVATDTNHTVTLSDFRSEYLERVKATVSAAEGALDSAWDVAGSRNMDMIQRVEMLRSIKRGAPSEVKKTIDMWIMSLLAGVEPARTGTARD